MSGEATITIPVLPPPEVSPNSRSHWRQKAKATAAFREAARLAMVDALNTPGSGASAFCGELGPVTIDAEIAWCCGRKFHDATNAPSLLKAAIDGLADAAWFGQDRHVTLGEVRQTRGDGRLTFTLRRAS